MRITVNGASHDLATGITVRELIAHLGLDGGPVAVERNLEVIPRREHDAAVLLEGDVVEIVHFVGGG